MQFRACGAPTSRLALATTLTLPPPLAPRSPSLGEVKNALFELGYTDKKHLLLIESMINAADTDGNGEVDIDEFVSLFVVGVGTGVF